MILGPSCCSLYVLYSLSIKVQRLMEDVSLLGWACFYPNVSNCLITAGSQGHPGTNSNSRSCSSQPKRPKNQGIGGHGEAEVRNRQESRVPGSEGALVWACISCCPNSRVHEAHLLGTLMGRHGTHLLLRYFNVLHGWLCIFPQDLERALFRGIFPEQVSREAEAPHEASELRWGKVQWAQKSLLSLLVIVFFRTARFNCFWRAKECAVWFNTQLKLQRQQKKQTKTKITIWLKMKSQFCFNPLFPPSPKI